MMAVIIIMNNNMPIDFGNNDKFVFVIKLSKPTVEFNMILSSINA